MNATTSNGIKTRIPLVVVGFDFRIASSALREQLVSSLEDRQQLFRAIQKIDAGAGLLVLETCNRLEWIVSTTMPEWIAELLKARMLDRWQRGFPDLENLPSPYVFTEKEAVLHVLQVVVGLESLATGEAQIAGQFQAALKNAQKEKTTTQVINRLSHIAGRIARSGYKMGFRSNYRQGIHGLVVKFLQNHFKEDVKGKLVLVAGMGEIGRKTAALVEEALNCKVQPVNRTIKPGHQGKWKALAELKRLSCEADALVVATGGRTAVIGPDNLHLEDRPEPLLVMDIGIPRQVSEPAQQHANLLYRNIDHLMELGENKEKDAYLTSLDAEIRKEFHQFKRYCQGREMSAMLSEIHAGRLDLTQKRIPDFVASRLSDLDEKRQKDIESALKQFIKEYSNNLFQAFHQTMETYWSNSGNGQQ
jgi:glutamyl-tRNA reductase